MSSQPVIKVENISKAYHLGQIGTGTLTNDLKVWWAKVRGKPNPLLKIGQKDHGNRDGETVWALQDVSFTVEQGEVLGIIGRNGAGKSTLLKILSRITAPTEGVVKVRGRIASLLEVGTGFHPELTGRENIFLNGAILGMTRAEVQRKLDEIVDFAEIEKFLDTPVKRYSSGMYVRLAFAVAAHLDPEILVVDEVLAVGDAGFQKKCLGKMGEVAREGRTVLFVSHNLSAIQNLCDRSILLKNGRIFTEGRTNEVINEYLTSVMEKNKTPVNKRVERSGDGRFRFKELKFKSVNGNVIKCGEKIDIIIRYESETKIKNVSISIGFYDLTGARALYLGNQVSGAPIVELPKNSKISCSFDKFPLLPGRYTLNLHCLIDGTLADWIREATTIVVVEGDFFGSGQLPPTGYGFTAVDQKWKVIVE
jgi:lipopolysaccharide transport system ATP-binding protein